MELQEILGYKVLKKIGLGGAITIYAVQDKENSDNTIIAKVFDESLAVQEDIQKRFDEMLPKIITIDHPNIIKTIAYTRTEDYMAILSEALSGQNLQFTVLIKGLSKQAVLEILSYIIKAVDYAHSKGVVHRNLKPSNIFLAGNFKKLKVLDFCVANVLGFDNPENILKHNFEKPMFMSPEMVKGDGVDIRSDIYSLGSLLYFMISHKTPYLKTAPSNVIMENIINDPIPEIKGYMKINDVIRKATAKNPDDRYQNCTELLNDIEKI